MQLITRSPLANPLRTLFDREPEPPVREETPPSEGALRRWQVMERIMELNATAREDYLEDFSDQSLAQYLAHLESVGSPRGARWERPGDSPAIMVRETEF